MERPKCLILYCNTGGGFKSPSVAVKKEFESSGYEVTMMDFAADMGSTFIDSAIKDAWIACLRMRWLFRFVIFTSDRPLLIRMLAKFMSRLGDKFYDLITKDGYDIVFSTHFASTQMLGDIRRRYGLRTPIFAYNSDVMNGQHAWVCNDLDAYFVPTKVAYDEMLHRGMDENKLRLMGFPIDKKFSELGDRLALRKKLGLSDKFTVLLVAGGEGIGKLYEYAESLLRLGTDVQVIVVCGKNVSLYNELKQLSGRYPQLNVFGYAENMHEICHCSDVVVGKAGFNFIFESIYLQKPMIINYFMANEAVGAKFVVDNGLGWQVNSVGEFSKLAKRIISDPSVLGPVRQNLKKFKYEPGAKEMVDYMIRFSNFKKGVKVLLFDLAGTLCTLDIEDRWHEINIDSITAVLKYVGIERYSKKSTVQLANEFVKEKSRLRGEAKRSLEEFPLREQLSAFLSSIEGYEFKKDEKSLEALESIFIRPELELAKPLPYVSDVLGELSKRYRLSLISNNASETLVNEILRKCKIEKFFSDIFVSCKIGFRKPHENFMNHVLKKLGMDPSECVVIGDRLNQDILMARNFNVKSVNVRIAEHKDNIGIENIHADYDIRDIRGLSSLL